MNSLVILILSPLVLAVSLKVNHHKMERHIPRTNFVQHSRSLANDLHELVFAVQQLNLDVLEKNLVERSSPSSSKYQKWLTFDEIGSLTSNEQGAKLITLWLETNGATITWTSVQQNYIKATATIYVWENLLDTTFYQWEDLSMNDDHSRKQKSRMIHRALEYSIPVDIKSHVSAVFNTVQTPPEFKPKFRQKENFDENAPFKTRLRLKSAKATASGKMVAANDGYVTVSFLNSLYRISSNLGSGNQSQSVFETMDMFFSQQDLAAFQNKYGLTRQAARYSVQETSACSTTSTSGLQCSEGNLDLQYLMGVAQRTATIYWYVDGSGSTDPFVAWITDVADERNPPQSNSISWGARESRESSSVMNAFNIEAMKLANMGVTIAVSSGDDGAPNSDSHDNCLCNGYDPSFPATSPYVTAVGATMGPNYGDPEVACQSNREGGVITTGGGFSRYFSAPDWQQPTISRYFAGLDASNTPVTGFNRNGRGYPDVSLIGVQYPVVIGGRIIPLYGTSASAPVFAAFVSLVNAARLAQGQPSIGFLNPTLYSVGGNVSSPWRFNDVTEGDNKCCAYSGPNPSEATCCTTGFLATEGWDPVTGWGSINYDAFSAIFEVASPYTVDIPPDNTSIPVSTIVLVLLIGALLLGAAYFLSQQCRKRTQGSNLYSAPHAPTVEDVEYPVQSMQLHVVQPADTRGLSVDLVRIQQSDYH